MDKKHINRLEAYLEQFVEGAFTNLFGNRIRAQELALRLARVMEDGCKAAQPGDPRPIAPDRFIIHANPQVQSHLLEEHPDLPGTLSQHLVDLATQSGYRLANTPSVKFLADKDLDTGAINIAADHTSHEASSTAAMKAINLPAMDRPSNAQIIIDDNTIIPLTQDVINIGRHPENDIVIDDPSVSRHHLQLRLRYGSYMLFDVRSRTGTLINGTLTREHHLHPGDIIRLGRTQIIYLHDEDEDDDGYSGEITRPYEPL